MPTLSSILVQRGAATMRAVEDAIARQVFHGGDLATNLLELSAVREDILTPILAESFGQRPAPPGALRDPDPAILRRVPSEVALRHAIFPLELEGRLLTVAAAEPLSATIEDDLGFALGLDIKQVIAPLVRVREAISKHYGVPLERRFLRLIARLDGESDPSPSVGGGEVRKALAMTMLRPISIPAPNFGTGVPSSLPEPPRLEDVPVTKTPFVAARTDVEIPSIPKSPAVPTDVPPTLGSRSSERVPPSTKLGAWHGGDTGETSSKTDPRALAGVLRDALRDGSKGTFDKRGPRRPSSFHPARRKGPFTASMAEQELDAATTSEAVLGVFFSFAEQFFEYSALFVMHGDLAAGHDASGPGADRAKVSGIGVPLDLPSMLGRARATRVPVVAPPDADGLDAELARDLGRSGSFGSSADATERGGGRSRRPAVAMLPIVLRNRVVAILYGDDGETSVELSQLGEVLSMVGLTANALERIAVRKKLAARGIKTQERPSVPVAKEGPAALARALDLPAPESRADARSEDQPGAEVSGAPEEVAPSDDQDPPVGGPPTGLNPEVGTNVRDAALFEGDDWSSVSTAKRAGPDEEPNLAGLDEPSQDSGITALPTEAGEAVRRSNQGPDESGLWLVVDDETADTQTDLHPMGFDDEPTHIIPARCEPLRGGPPDPLVDEMALRFSNPAAEFPRIDPLTPSDSAVTVEMKVPEHPQAPIVLPPTSRLLEPRADDAAPVRSATPTRRGQAPTFEGRSTSRGAPASGFEPLPRTPPPNATSVSPADAPPAGPLSVPPRPLSERPIPREDTDAPSRSILLAATDATPLDRSRQTGLEPSILVQRVIDGGPSAKEAFQEIVRNGEAVVQLVMARFPGPLRIDRHRARAELPPASQCGPLLELVVAVRRPSLPFVSVRTSSADPEIRFWATHVLGELPFVEAANVLVPRLFDDDASVRRIAKRSAAQLVRAGAAGAPILKGLDHITRSPDQPIPHRVTAIDTMGEIRSGAMVPSLLMVLDDHNHEVAEAARRALLLLTRQDFGRDVFRWRDWWERNGSRHRIEWLMDALMHEQQSIRRAAGDELKLLTKEYFGYYDDLPKRERERALGLYRAWWEREGQKRFS